MAAPRVRVYSYPSNNNWNGDGTSAPVPITPLQALMEAAPGQEPEESLFESWPRLDRVNAAVDELLDEREHWVIQALFWRRLTLREVGRELSLSKTQVARIRDTAVEKLAVALSEDQELE